MPDNEAGRLDFRSPVPLYHQLAEALRYRIATGGLARGTLLPSLRRAAQEWGVNLHTVRHAYARLAELGLVRTSPPRGTVVIGASKPARTQRSMKLESFVQRVADQARRDFKVSAQELAGMLVTLGGDTRHSQSAIVYVVECSETQAADLAGQIEQRWDVVAIPFSLQREGEPPPGHIVATFFHHNDIRTRWPERFPTVRFASIRPDHALEDRLKPFLKKAGRTKALLCERDADMARNIAADLEGTFSRKLAIEPFIEGDPGAALRAADKRQPVLFAPRVWGALSEKERSDPRALEVRYVFDAAEADAVAAQLGWRRRGVRRVSMEV